MTAMRRSAAAVAAIVTATAGLLAGSVGLAGTASASDTFIGTLHKVTPIASAIPHIGDVNPYGVAVVPRSVGDLREGNVLVSNFNDSGNIQGTGTTIVQVTPGGKQRLFAQIGNLGSACPGGVGLTTALVALRSGWVIVGSLPTQQVNNNTVLSGDGCLIVAKTDPNALVIGPTGVGLGRNGTLYVADTASSRIAAIPHAVLNLLH